jgi:hypothetical protein
MWALLAAVALLWPARTAGLLDGLPLESTIANAVLLGVVLPTLLWFHRRFLRAPLARAAILALLVCKAVGALALTPDGWCVRFEPPRPLVKDAATNVPHSWDVRADWLSDRPACSALMRHAYRGLGEFPVWFFNLPPAGEGFPTELDRPPGARTGMVVTGFVDAIRPGRLQFVLAPDMNATVAVDGVRVDDAVTLSTGVHQVRLDAMMTGDVWRLVPLWNGDDLWKGAGVIATMKRPSRVDALARPIAGWVVTALAGGLIAAWIASMIVRIGSAAPIAWMVLASALLAGLASTSRVDAARWLVAALAASVLVPVPARLRNVFGAFVLVGVPWLTLIVVANAHHIGHFTWYTAGDDFWTYQRFGYRIVMQGYWLEGGTRQFYFQPLYRWVSGLLHLAFGDSSAGEFFWDGACLLASAMLAFWLTRASAGFRWGLLAAVVTLTVVALGAPWGLIGRGLSEITSAGFLYSGAFLALRARRGSLAWAIAAGILATLAFYTRLNNLPMAAGVALCAMSARVPFRRFFRANAAFAIDWRTAVVVPSVLGAGLLLFAWRNWYFNGEYSVFYGTQRNIVALWQPGISAAALVSKWLDSLLMVLTVHDPPAFDWRALPVLAGALVAPLSLLGVPRLRDVPALPSLFFLAGISAAFIARGWTYQGRFSAHVIGVTSALAVMGLERVVRRRRPVSASVLEPS